MKFKKHIIITGAHGTGKSTLLNHYKDLGYNCITEVIRGLNKELQVKINEEGDEVGQKIIFDTYKKLLSSKKGWISDRGLTDVTAYTFTLWKDGRGVREKFAISYYKKLAKFHKDHPDIIVCYVPIEFDIEDDGVRSTDKQFQKDVDFMIKNLLDSLSIPYITITGSVEERIKQLDEIILSE